MTESARRAAGSPSDEAYILTTSCPDTTGIVAGVAGFLSTHKALITEAQHYNDADTATSFMRTVFRSADRGLQPLVEIDREFAASVGRRFKMTWRFHDARHKCKALLAVSRQGHCLNSILHRLSAGTLPLDAVGVISNHQDLRSLAEWHGLPYHYLPIIDGDKASQEQRIIDLFEKSGAELLVLARYMQILSPESCRYFEGRAINIHHSFLPGFKGARAYHQAHQRGVKLIGATAHYVTTDLDEGPIIEQGVERVDHSFSAESLAVVGGELESIVLNRALQWHAERRVFRNGRKTVVLK